MTRPASTFSDAVEIVSPVQTRPPLPSRSLGRGDGAYARDLHVERDGEAFRLVLVSHEIDRNGEKDTFTETVSRHATLGEAVATMEGYGAPEPVSVPSPSLSHLRVKHHASPVDMPEDGDEFEPSALELWRTERTW